MRDKRRLADDVELSSEVTYSIEVQCKFGCMSHEKASWYTKHELRLASLDDAFQQLDSLQRLYPESTYRLRRHIQIVATQSKVVA